MKINRTISLVPLLSLVWLTVTQNCIGQVFAVATHISYNNKNYTQSEDNQIFRIVGTKGVRFGFDGIFMPSKHLELALHLIATEELQPLSLYTDEFHSDYFPLGRIYSVGFSLGYLFKCIDFFVLPRLKYAHSWLNSPGISVIVSGPYHGGVINNISLSGFRYGTISGIFEIEKQLSDFISARIFTEYELGFNSQGSAGQLIHGKYTDANQVFHSGTFTFNGSSFNVGLKGIFYIPSKKILIKSRN